MVLSPFLKESIEEEVNKTTSKSRKENSIEKWDSYPEAGKKRFRILVSGAAQNKLKKNLSPGVTY